ncbi:DUF3857 domain-containing transglutaminase family protein [Lacinutrix neustonica]|uniref:DUF3857 domain-containing transglutaminase family protein n=1 Tax=Lacinutrix neustonica TaxID=2980107 RepID=A0A9E8SGA2_9FLAO|nr:DUF3857 domain-containing transglutaminase family protein [Lacinutrix neustonica]WAC01535.1 DUF3857 domain-containing transglutaminase family protein [Lacinutrix neustonica]
MSSLTLKKELTKDANAVVRLNDVEINILSHDKMNIKKHRVVTVLNKNGERYIDANIRYDKSVNIKKLEAVVFNHLGEEIKKFRKNDFEDISVYDGVSIFNDDRTKYISYTATQYPYTIEYFEETEQSTTAFIQQWYPLEDYYVSTETSSIQVNNTSGVVLVSKTSRFDGFNISKHSEFHFSAENIPAIKYEQYAPSFISFAPNLKFALQEFDMKGMKGVNTSWKDFGKWVGEALINDTQKLPEAVIEAVQTLTADAKTDYEKAKIVYQFMQNKTRYISVQVGIGGWKPMLAEDVDRLGYGDCKALSNYTKSLLKAVGVESYYTLIYGGRDIKNIDRDFSSQQGNHAILALPVQGDLIFLECTSQTDPFGYIANFTDDRDVLIIKPEGGEIVHTTAYETKDNLQSTKAAVFLDEFGDFEAEITITSKGTQYAYHRSQIENETKKNQKLHYKNYLDNINNLSVSSMNFENDKDEIVFKESLALSATKYGAKAGTRLLLNPNMFNRKTKVPPRYPDRHLGIEIDRGYTDIDEYELTLSNRLSIDALQDNVSIKNKFGEYTTSFEKISEHVFIYKRKLIINKGYYAKDDYKAFRTFNSQIVKNDNSKIVLKQL